MGAGKMLRLRGFNADPEWRGKWADNDAAWTNHHWAHAMRRRAGTAQTAR